MAGFVDLERIAARADRDLSRLDSAQTAEARRYLSSALRRTLDDARVAYDRAMLDVRGTESGAAFRLARARVLVDELDGTLRSIGNSDPLLTGLANRAAASREQGRDFVEATLRTFGEAVTISTPVNHSAIAGVVENASTRLRRHAEDVVDRIKDDVVTALVRGDSWSTLSRAIREDTGYLRSRAEMIALTELHSAQADARKELYGELGVELVIRYVTLDDRTCETCAPRQGEVTKASETEEVLHPYCRCVLAPFDPEWVLDGELDAEELLELREDNLRILEELGKEPNLGRAPFERERPRAVWRPGMPFEALDGFVGRAFRNLSPVRTTPTPSSPPGLPTDPVEQSRVLPTRVRAELDRIEADAASLRTASERAAAERTSAIQARNALSEEMRTVRADLPAAQRVVRDLDRELVAARERVLEVNPQLRAMSLADRDAALSGLLRDVNRRLDDAIAAVRAVEARGEELSRRLATANEAVLAASARATEAKRELDAFLRVRSQATIANARTGHPDGTVSTKVRIRDAGMQARADDAVDWLNTHTVFGNGTRDVVADLRRRDARARYRPWERTAYVSRFDGASVYVHELAHAIEHASPSVGRRAVAYRESRTVGERAVKMQRLRPGAGYGAREVSKPDAFRHPYVGVIYDEIASEIVSMGLQWMYENPIAFAREDPGHFDFILRLMKGLPDP